MSRPGYSADTAAADLLPPRGRLAPPVPSSAHDEPGTVRVHPDDDRNQLDARRAILSDDRDDDTPWDILTGNHRLPGARVSLSHEQVVGWPRQSLADLAAALGHPGILPGDERDEIERTKGTA